MDDGPGVIEESCGATHPLIDDGAPCIKFQGHTQYANNQYHITANGIWWES